MSSSRVYLQVQRVDKDLCRIARALTVSDLHEAMRRNSNAGGGTMSPRMRPLNRGLRIAGPAVTASCAPGDNLMMHRALFLAEAGDVLVVQAATTGAQWGDIAAQYARKKGLEGVVVDGCIRDTDTLESMRFPVWSTLIGPSSPEKKGHGMVNAPIACDGVQIEPGDLVVADGDGVIVIPKACAADVVANASKRMQREEALSAAILAGEHPWDFVGAVDHYRKLDVEEINGPWRP